MEPGLSRPSHLCTLNPHFLGPRSQSWCQEGGDTQAQVLEFTIFPNLPAYPHFLSSARRKPVSVAPLNASWAVVGVGAGGGWGAGSVDLGGRGALHVQAVPVGCQGFPSRLQSQAWSQIYALPGSRDGIPRSYRQLVKRNHCGNCKLASKNCKDSFTQKLTPADVM